MSEIERTTAGAGTQGGFEPCEECGAPLDAQQRYCVNCAARRGNGANPSSRYFAQVNKKTRRPLTGPQKKPPPTSRAAAVGFFALLPIAVAIGVVVGRSGSSDNGNEEALLKALQSRESQVASNSAPTTENTASKAKANKKAEAKKSKGEKAAAKDGGKVVAKTNNGTVHQVTGYKPDEKKVEEDTKLVEENPEQTGENYIKAQQNLPDVIVVGGEGGGGGSTGGPEP